MIVPAKPIPHDPAKKAEYWREMYRKARFNSAASTWVTLLFGVALGFVATFGVTNIRADVKEQMDRAEDYCLNKYGTLSKPLFDGSGFGCYEWKEYYKGRL